MANVGKAAGGTDQAVKLFELPPGESLCPYHYEYEEEWLLVLDGQARVRTPDGEHELAAGDIVRFATGPDGAHRVTAAPDTAARVLMFSSARKPAVAVYPDSDKIGVWPGRRRRQRAAPPRRRQPRLLGRRKRLTLASVLGRDLQREHRLPRR